MAERRNGGTGWGGGWVFRNGTQFFLGGSSTNGDGDTTAPFGDINTAGRAWGIGTTAVQDFTLAGRDLSGTLDVGQKIGFDFDNGYGRGGSSIFAVVLRNTTTGGAYRALWSFVATGTSTYYIEDDTGQQSVTIPAFTDEGLHLEFTLTSATTYSVDISGLGGAPTTYTGGLLVPDTGDQLIRSFSFGAFQQGNTAAQIGYVNSVYIVPEPSTGVLMIAGLLGYAFHPIRKRRNA